MRRKSVLVSALLATAVWTATSQAAVYTDDFETYAPGALGGQGGWTGAHAGRIDVVAGGGEGGTQGLRITDSTSPTVQTINNIAAVEGDANGLVTITFDIRGGTQDRDTTMWSLYFNDAAGQNMARLYTGSGTVRGRIAGLGGGFVTDPMVLSSNGVWDTVRVTIDTVAKTSFFELSLNGAAFIPFGASLPGVFVNPLNYSSQTSATAVGQIVWESTTNAEAAGHVISFDNLSVVPEPATLSLLALSALWMRRRRAA